METILEDPFNLIKYGFILMLFSIFSSTFIIPRFGIIIFGFSLIGSSSILFGIKHSWDPYTLKEIKIYFEVFGNIILICLLIGCSIALYSQVDPISNIVSTFIMASILSLIYVGILYLLIVILRLPIDKIKRNLAALSLQDVSGVYTTKFSKSEEIHLQYLFDKPGEYNLKTFDVIIIEPRTYNGMDDFDLNLLIIDDLEQFIDSVSNTDKYTMNNLVHIDCARCDTPCKNNTGIVLEIERVKDSFEDQFNPQGNIVCTKCHQELYENLANERVLPSSVIVANSI